MSSPATTNITIGSILEILAPTTVAPRDSNDRPVFDSLLQPPMAPRAPASPARSPQSEQWRGSRKDAAHDSSGSIAPPAAANQRPAEGVQPATMTSDDADDEFSSEYDIAPQDDAASEVITAHEDEQLEAEALAGAMIAVPLALLADNAATDELQPEAPAVDVVAPSAARRSRGKPSTTAALQTATGIVVDDKPVLVETEGASEGMLVDKDVKRRAAGRLQEGPPSTANGQTNDAVSVQADGSLPTTNDLAAQKATGAFEAIPQLQIEPDPNASTLTRDDRKPEAQSDASAVTAETPTGETKLLDQPAVTNGIPNASAVVAPTVTSNATNASTSPGDSSPPIGSSPPTSARSRLPMEVFADGSDGVRRHSRVEVDTARLLSRVTRAFQSAQQRDGELRLRLSPPELGSLRLLVQIQDGALVARLETETSAAKTAIIDNLPALRERLAEQGLRVERFDVDLMQQQSGGMPDRPRDQERDASLPIRNSVAERPRGESSLSARSTASAIDKSGRLNVII